MIINLTEVLSLEGKTKTYNAEVSLETFDCRLGSYKIIDKYPLELKVTNKGNKKLELNTFVKLSLIIPCDRCLTDVITPLEIEVDEVVDLRASEEDRIEQLDEQDYIKGYNLDVDRFVYGEILLNLPMKTLCSEDCKGICNICGANLNFSTCNCEHEERLDPRMSVIHDIFKNFKEV